MEPIELTVDNVKLLSGPGVYLYKHGKKILYVGASTCGLGRAFGPNHKMRLFPERELSLTFIPCATANEAFELEIQLITEHAPRYNAKNTGGLGVELPTWEELRRKAVRDAAIARGELPSLRDLM